MDLSELTWVIAKFSNLRRRPDHESRLRADGSRNRRQLPHRSPNGVMCHLKALEKKGLITREPNMSRAIQITDAYREERGMPLVGQIAAGNLTEAIEQADRFDFEDWFPQRKNQFALKVKGDSMIEAQIADGDIVICRRARTAHKGDIVVAITDEGEATLKYWYPEANRVRLQPANSSMKPIYSTDSPGDRDCDWRGASGEHD